MPEIDSDLFQVLALLLMLVSLIVLLAVFSTLSTIRKQLDQGSSATANTSAPTLEQATYDYEPSVSTYEPVQTAAPVTTTAPEPMEEASTGFVSVADAVSTQVEPTPVAADPAASGSIGLRGDEPEEQPFERDGRWWFKRGAELLVYDEGTGQWVAPSSTGAVAPADTATTAFTTTSTALQADAGEGWRCPSCGAINGSTASSCRMCFAPR